MAKKVLAVLLMLAMVFSLAACQSGEEGSKEITKDTIKVGVIHIGDPADGSGYSYAHDQGIVGMVKNLGLDEEKQIVRKLNIADGDPAAIKTAIEECISEGCNLIFGTSYGYMDTMEAEYSGAL